MEEENYQSDVFFKKITDLSELELKKIKLDIAIYLKNVEETVQNKIKLFDDNLKNHADVYNQKIDMHQEFYDNFISKYKTQISQINQKYNELFINMQLELQETEYNQKITLANLKKFSDIKRKLQDATDLELLDEYNRKIEACIEKNDNYKHVIKYCEDKIDNLMEDFENSIEKIFSDSETQLIMSEKLNKVNFFDKIFNKIFGFKRYRRYLTDEVEVKLDIKERLVSDALEQLEDSNIKFVSEVQKMKNIINGKFNLLIKGNQRNFE